MALSRKHYVLIAEAIRETYDEEDNTHTKATIAIMVSKLAARLNQDNSRFDRTKFVKAALGR